MTLVFVDCEFSGPCIGKGKLTEFGAVIYKTKKTFYGDMRNKTFFGKSLTMWYFLRFLRENCKTRPIFVSDNPAADWQWINYWFHHALGMNPFGWSARRIGDYYAGIKGNFMRSTDWKRLRKTKHDHNPVNDAMGNEEAFEEIEAKLAEKIKEEELRKKFDDIFIERRPMTGGTADYKMPKGAILL